MKPNPSIPRSALALLLALSASAAVTGCKPKNLVASAQQGGAAEKVFVPPGKHDEFYNIVSGGFSGNVSVYGLPSGRLFRVIPVFSQVPESGWGYTEETKPMLNTSHGELPWDDSHHITLSVTKGEHDGRWAFVNSQQHPARGAHQPENLPHGGDHRAAQQRGQSLVALHHRKHGIHRSPARASPSPMRTRAPIPTCRSAATRTTSSPPSASSRWTRRPGA